MSNEENIHDRLLKAEYQIGRLVSNAESEKAVHRDRHISFDKEVEKLQGEIIDLKIKYARATGEARALGTIAVVLSIIATFIKLTQ